MIKHVICAPTTAWSVKICHVLSATARKGNQVLGLASLQLVVRGFFWDRFCAQHADHEVPISHYHRTSQGGRAWQGGSFQDMSMIVYVLRIFSTARLWTRRNELQSKPLEACGPTNWSGSSCCDECRKRLLHILGTGHQSCQGSSAEAWDVRRLGKRSGKVYSCEYLSTKH